MSGCKPDALAAWRRLDGGAGRIRTDNVLLAGQVLCWVELRPHGAIDGCCPRYLLLDRQAPLLVWLRPRGAGGTEEILLQDGPADLLDASRSSDVPKDILKVAASTGVAPVSSGLKDPDPELLEDEAE